MTEEVARLNVLRTNETDFSDGPAGVAGLAESRWALEMSSGVAPVIWTMVGGAPQRSR